jgi:hypothetical protein
VQLPLHVFVVLQEEHVLAVWQVPVAHFTPFPTAVKLGVHEEQEVVPELGQAADAKETKNVNINIIAIIFIFIE